MQFKGKRMNQTSENGKKHNFGLDFGLFVPSLGPKTFSQNLTLSDVRYHGQQSSCTISEKTDDSILRKLIDGWTDSWVDRQSDRQE